MAKSWLKSRWLAFDTETSGAYPYRYQVIQLGWVVFQGHTPVGYRQFLIRSDRDFDRHTVPIHGLSPDFVSKGMDPQEALSFFAKDLQSVDFAVAHHAPFDMGFIMALADAHDWEPFDTPVLCTSLLARRFLGNNVPNVRLKTLVKHFNLGEFDHHQSLEDAIKCAEVFLKLQDFWTELDLQSVMETIPEVKNWNFYSFKRSGYAWKHIILDSIMNKQLLVIDYSKGRWAGQWVVEPLGVVLSGIDGNYLPARVINQECRHRFLFDHIDRVKIVSNDLSVG